MRQRLGTGRRHSRVRRSLSICAAACIAACVLVPAPAQAEDDSEFVVEIIHSSLPLYTFEWEDLWPRSFTDGDSFGCASPIEFGDWRFTPAEAHEQGEEA